LVDRIVTLEKGHNIKIAGGPTLGVQGDSDQLEQLLINLLRNAVDAVRETGGAVRVGWQRLPGSSPPTMELWVEDDGPGLSTTSAICAPTSCCRCRRRRTRSPTAMSICSRRSTSRPSYG